MKECPKEVFLNALQSELNALKKVASDASGDWVVKGFIDISENIYTISTDAKVVSKIMELLIFPVLCRFAKNHNYKMVLSKEQNFYPDITFIDSRGDKYALDIKSTYRKNKQTVNGLTLGAFTGYFRNRESTKNIMFPYSKYKGHFVLGIIYSRQIESERECIVYKLSDLVQIPSVIRDIQFFVQEKFKIAIDRPGSGNTKNIGGASEIEILKNGTGIFSKLGEKVFDEYWMEYLTRDMARSVELPRPPYSSLEEFLRKRGYK